MAVQVKRWKRNVQAPVVQQVRGSLGAHEQGLIITTSDFSTGVRKEAARPDAIPVGLMNGEQLVLLLAEHEIGVTRRSHYLLSLRMKDNVKAACMCLGLIQPETILFAIHQLFNRDCVRVF